MPAKPRRLVSYYISPGGSFLAYTGEDHRQKANPNMHHVYTVEFRDDATDAEVHKFFEGFTEGYRRMRDQFRALLDLPPLP